MGQKVNPVGFRLGVNRGWDSVWYAKKKDFGNYLIEDFKIREYIKKNVINSGVSKVMIERTSNKCYVTIYTSRPGFVIGKKGSDIDKIKNNLSKFTTNEVNLNIKEVKKPETNAYLVAENIAQQLVKRISYRRAMKRAMQSCIRLGAKGIKVSVSGRLGGKIARSAGSSVTISGLDGNYSLIKLASGEVRKIDSRSLATIGILSNPDQKNIKIGKAGRSRWLGRRPHTRGVVKNPVDHPHGGGEGKSAGGRHPVSPTGQSAKGLKTRDNKRTDKFIVKRRNKRKDTK